MKRPLIRYFGGKFRLKDWIIPYFPPHKVYTEVFGGGGSILLSKPPSKVEVYNDLDDQIFNLFKVARDRGPELVEKIKLTPYARSEFELVHEPSEYELERARRTFVRSWFSIGTDSIHRGKAGFRCSTDSSNVGTLPLHGWENIPENLSLICERLKRVLIENDDALVVLGRNDYADALHYVDPPYPEETRSSGGYRFELTTEDHVRLAEKLKSLKGMVILSGYQCDLYQDLFSNWERFDQITRADSRLSRTESIWLNPRASQMNPQKDLFSQSA